MYNDEALIENLIYLHLRILNSTRDYIDKTVAWRNVLGEPRLSFVELEQLGYAKFPPGSVNMILTQKGEDFLLSKVNINQIIQEYLFSDNLYKRTLAANYIKEKENV